MDETENQEFIENQEELFKVLKAGKEKAKASKKIKGGDRKHQRKEKKAGLMFPVGTIGRRMKDMGIAKRVSGSAPVFMAAILEYLTAEILELSGNACMEHKKTRIMPRHIQLAIHKDDELAKYMGSTTIASGGVMPHIPQRLLESSSTSRPSTMMAPPSTVMQAPGTGRSFAPPTSAQQ